MKDALTKGNVLSFKHKYSDALEWYEKAIATDPRNAEAWFHKGHVLSQLRKYDEAIKCYDKAIEIHPNYFLPSDNKRTILEKLGKRQEARYVIKNSRIISNH